MADSAGGRFASGSLALFLVIWVLMMAAMMFPSVWPAAAIFRLVVRRRVPGREAIGRSAAFVAGYLASWTAFGFVAFGILAAARATRLGALTADDLARYALAPAALAAAAYQVVPFKQACLRHCRGPLSFFLEHWRDGARGAVAMGGRHGAYCVGCCWLLMIVLLALGIMSLAWMAIVALAIALEKLAPRRAGRAASLLLTAGLVALALVALLRPGWIPGMNGTMNDTAMSMN